MDLDERDRLRQMYDAHYGAVLAYALRRTANAEDAGDVVSEVFLTAWRRIDAVPGGEAARLWLYGTARRVIANQTRAMRRQKRLSERLGREPSHSPLAGDTAEPGAASAAFAALSAEDRDLLGLVAWEGLSHREVAAVLGCSVNAAKLRAHRARRRFAASLAERGATRPRRTSLRASDPQVAQAPAEG